MTRASQGSLGKRTSLLSGSAIYLFSNIIVAAIPFALLPVLTRFLTKDEYGQVAMFQTAIAALVALTGVSVQGAANRKYYDHDVSPGEMAHFIGACLQILLVTTGLVLLLLLPVRTPLASWLGLEARWLLWAVVVASAGVVIQLRLGQWQVRGQALRYGALQITQAIFGMGLSLLLVVALLYGAAGRISSQILITTACAAAALALLAKDSLVAWSWRPEYVREALRFGVPLIPHIAGTFLLSAVDRVVINAELGLEQAGVYMVAVQLTMAMAIVFDAINKAYVPWLFERLKRDHLAEKRRIVKLTYGYFAAVLAAAALAFIVGPPIVVWIAGEPYRAAGDVVGWLALGRAFAGMYLMVTNYIFFSKRTGLLSLSTISSGLLNLALLVVLVGILGLRGAAISFAIAMAARFLLTWRIAHLRHPMPWFHK